MPTWPWPVTRPAGGGAPAQLTEKVVVTVPPAGTLIVRLQFPSPQPMFMSLYRRTPDVPGNVADVQNVRAALPVVDDRPHRFRTLDPCRAYALTRYTSAVTCGCARLTTGPGVPKVTRFGTGTTEPGLNELPTSHM